MFNLFDHIFVEAMIIAMIIRAHAEIVFIVFGFVLTNLQFFVQQNRKALMLEKSRTTQEIIKIIN